MSYTTLYQTLKKNQQEVIQLLHDKDMRDDVRKVDVGIIIGMGYDFDMGLRLCLASEFGFIKVYKNINALNAGGNFSIGFNLAKWFNLSFNHKPSNGKL